MPARQRDWRLVCLVAANQFYLSKREYGEGELHPEKRGGRHSVLRRTVLASQSSAGQTLPALFAGEVTSQWH